MNSISAGASPSPASTAAKASRDGLQAPIRLEKNIGSRTAPGGKTRSTNAGLSLNPPTTARARKDAASAQSSWLGVSNTLRARSVASAGPMSTPNAAR